MSLLTNIYQGSDGVYLTAATSGGASGDAYQLVNPSNTAAIAYTALAVNPITGFNSTGKFDASLNVATGIGEVRFVQAAAICGAQQVIIKFNGAPTVSTCVLMQSRGTIQNADLRISTSGIVHLALADNSTLGLIGGTAIDMSSSSPWYVIDFWLAEGTTSSNGQAKYQVRALNNLTTVLYSADSGAARNTGVQGTHTITDWRVGKFTQAATLPAFYIAQHSADYGAADFIADPIVYVPPTGGTGTVYRHTFEGWSIGQTITTGGSGSGTPLGEAPATGGGTVVASTAGAVHGIMGATLTVPLGAIVGVGWTALDVSQLSGAGIMKFTSYPTSSQRIVNTYLMTGSSLSPHLNMNTDGTLTMCDATHTAIFTSPNPVPLNVPVEIQLYVKLGTTISNGTIYVKVTRRDNDTVFWDPGRQNFVNATVTNYSGIRFGIPSASVWDTVVYVDDLAYSVDTDGLVDAYDATVSNAGPDQYNIEPWTIVTLVASGIGSWSQVSGAAVILNGSGTTQTFTAPASFNAQTLTFSYGTGQMIVTVLPATDAVYSNGQWVPIRLVSGANL